MADVSVRLHHDGDRLVTLKFDTKRPERVGEWLKEVVGTGTVAAIGPDKMWQSMGQFASDVIHNIGGELVVSDDAEWVYNVYRFPNGQLGLRVFDGGTEVYYGRVKDYTPPVNEARTIADALEGRYTVDSAFGKFVLTPKGK